MHSQDETEHRVVPWVLIGCTEDALRKYGIPYATMGKYPLLGVFGRDAQAMSQFVSAVKKIHPAWDPHAGWTTLEELLQDKEVSCYLFANNGSTAFDHVCDTIARGKHGLFGELLAVNEEQLLELATHLQDARTQHCIVSGCQSRRFDQPYKWLKEHLAYYVGHLGSVQTFEHSILYTAEKARKWRDPFAHYAGAQMDIAHWLFEHQGVRFKKPVLDQNSYVISGQRADGIKFRFHADISAQGIHKDIVRIRFQNGSLEWESHQGRIVVKQKGEKNKVAYLAPSDPFVRRAAMIRNIMGKIGIEDTRPFLQDVFANTAIGVRMKKESPWIYDPEEWQKIV